MTPQSYFNFDPEPPAKRYVQRNHPDTADAAARSVNAEQARAKVLEFIRSQGGYAIHDEEIAKGLGMKENTARPRRFELAQRGLIVPAGKRATASGCMAITWVAAEFAHVAVLERHPKYSSALEDSDLIEDIPPGELYAMREADAPKPED